MKFLKFKKQQPSPPEDESVKVDHPYITFTVIDGVNLDIELAWPLDGDIKPFAHFLTMLNSGRLLGPQLTEAVLYANRVQQPEKALVIHASLETVPQKKANQGRGKPIISPSKVIPLLLKSHFN